MNEWNDTQGIVFDATCPACGGTMARGNYFCSMHCYTEFQQVYDKSHFEANQ